MKLEKILHSRYSPHWSERNNWWSKNPGSCHGPHTVHGVFTLTYLSFQTLFRFTELGILEISETDKTFLDLYSERFNVFPIIRIVLFLSRRVKRTLGNEGSGTQGFGYENGNLTSNHLWPHFPFTRVIRNLFEFRDSSPVPFIFKNSVPTVNFGKVFRHHTSLFVNKEQVYKHPTDPKPTRTDSRRPVPRSDT